MNKKMTKKKILIISNNPFYGGGESFIVDTLTPLNKEYDLLYVIKNQTLKEKIKNDLIMLKGKSFISNTIEIKHTINKFKPDITIYNGGSSLYISLFQTGKKILIRHSTNKGISEKPSLKLLLHNILLHLSYWNSDKIIHVSEFSFKEQKFFRNKGLVIHNGIKIKKEYYKSITDLHTPLKFLYVGRVEESKGLDLISTSISQYSPNTITLDIVGEGSYMEKLKKENFKNIILHGFQTQLDNYYKNADIFITLPTHENLPISVLEAMNNALMVICSKIGGLPELIEDKKNGILIDRDKKEIKEAIEFCINNKEQIITFGNTGKDKCKRDFDIQHSIENYKQVISSLINK